MTRLPHSFLSPDANAHLPRVFALICILALASLTFAQPEPQNPTPQPVSPPFGLVRIVLPPLSHALVSTPFDPTDPSLESVLAGQLSVGDRVLVWADSRYRTAAKMDPSEDGVSWFELNVPESGEETVLGPAGDAFNLTPGVGFVLCNRQTFAQTVRLSGRLILEAAARISIPQGINPVAYPFTSARDLKGTQWSGSVSLAPDTNRLELGAASWATATTNVQWQEPRPYANPFSLSNAAVRIADLILDPDKVTLDIRVTDASVQAFDILVRDLETSGIVTDWARDWRLAASNIAVAGQTELHWCDDLSASGSSFKGVRLYLVLRADAGADLDGDGTPDLRQYFLRQSSDSKDLSPDGTTSLSTPQDLSGPLAPSVTLPLPRSLSGSIGTVIYVNIITGSDAFTGRTKTIRTGKQIAGGVQEGPKKTIKAAIRDAGEGDTIEIQDGAYPEDLNIAGKPINATVSGSVELRSTGK